MASLWGRLKAAIGRKLSEKALADKWSDMKGRYKHRYSETGGVHTILTKDRATIQDLARKLERASRSKNPMMLQAVLTFGRRVQSSITQKYNNNPSIMENDGYRQRAFGNVKLIENIVKIAEKKIAGFGRPKFVPESKGPTAEEGRRRARKEFGEAWWPKGRKLGKYMPPQVEIYNRLWRNK